MADVEARLDKHEAICAERYERMMQALDRIDRRTEQHTTDIQDLKQKASQHTGAWKTMLALGAVFGILVSLLRIQGML